MSDASIPVPPPRNPFPWWVIGGGLLLAAAYLPTLAAPFDFTDDGNLVYPTPGLTLSGHAELWWQKVVANVEHLGPFRPVVWAHWHLEANLFGDSALAWRIARLGWCGVAAITLLWLMRELKLHPTAALVASAAAMWNPYRNEIWTSLTLAEGVAMPYAMLALVAARKATGAARPWQWDVAALFGLLMALGCKNTFVALLPPMLLLRVWADGRSLRESLRANGRRAAVYLLPVLLPVGHFVYFKLHPAPCHYETPGPSWEQAKQFALWLKGTAGADFLAVGVGLAVAAMGWQRLSPLPVGGRSASATHETGGGKIDHPPSRLTPSTDLPLKGGGDESGTAVPRLPLWSGLLLLLSGFLIYLPVAIMCGRYTMPAVWGVDVLLASALTRFLALPQSWVKQAAWVGLAGGLAAVMIAGVNRQEKVAARSKMLWQLLEHVERTVPPGATIEWVSGPTDSGELNAEEGIHFYWHLLHRGRIDVRLGLVDAGGVVIQRVELAPLTVAPRYRIAAGSSADPFTWQAEREVSVRYRFGAKAYTCVFERRREASPNPIDPLTDRLFREALGGFDPVKKLLAKPDTGGPGVAERRK